MNKSTLHNIHCQLWDESRKATTGNVHHRPMDDNIHNRRIIWAAVVAIGRSASPNGMMRVWQRIGRAMSCVYACNNTWIIDRFLQGIFDSYGPGPVQSILMDEGGVKIAALYSDPDGLPIYLTAGTRADGQRAAEKLEHVISTIL